MNHIRATNFKSDCEAMRAIEKNYKVSSCFVITARNSERAPTDRELAAINYLCDEWDYGYSDESET